MAHQPIAAHEWHAEPHAAQHDGMLWALAQHSHWPQSRTAAAAHAAADATAGATTGAAAACAPTYALLSLLPAAQLLDTMWLHGVLGSIGEQFDDGEEICGIVVNVRPKQASTHVLLLILLCSACKDVAAEAAMLGRWMPSLLGAITSMAAPFHSLLSIHCCAGPYQRVDQDGGKRGAAGAAGRDAQKCLCCQPCSLSAVCSGAGAYWRAPCLRTPFACHAAGSCHHPA